jgi:Uma2 family endonuclease
MIRPIFGSELMNAVASKASYTVDDLLAMPDEKDYELWDGRLVERNTCVRSRLIISKIHSILTSYRRKNPCGWLLPEGSGFRCFPGANRTVRRPDVSFIREERLPPKVWAEIYLPIPPDLATIVISAKDRVGDLYKEVADYLGVGVPLVWVVHPVLRAVCVHRAGGPVSWLGERDELSGEGVLPGFCCRVADLFGA